jgi:septal ring factor EnvC (AmiA/AmiB activator)
MQVRIVDERDGWLKIERNGLVGFIRNHPRLVRITKIDETRPAGARDPEQKHLKDLQQRADTIREKLETSRSELNTISRKEQDILNEWNATGQHLDRVRRSVRETQSALESLHAQIADIQMRHQQMEKQISAQEGYAAQRLVALYKMDWANRVNYLASADSFSEFIFRKSSLERILDQDEALLGKLNMDQTALQALMEQLNARKAEKKSLELTLKQRLAELNDEQEKRGKLLALIRSEKQLQAAVLQSLKKAAQELDTTMQRLEPAAEAQSTRVADIDSAGGSDAAFVSYKGLLSWPVRGKILSFFGPYQDEKYDIVNFQSGIDIRAERGEPIRSVADGHAIFSNWFKGFGNMVIIDHGDHYYTVYAHLEEVFKKKGDRVEKGEVIATVGDSDSLKGPALHFEVRHHGKPVDPLQWMKEG